MAHVSGMFGTSGMQKYLGIGKHYILKSTELYEKT